MPARIVNAWNGGYHVNVNTFGTWLRGDARGWRARHHREHVDGDYRNPPDPDAHRTQLLNSKRSMKEPPVHLLPEARRLACGVFIETFNQRSIDVVACAINDHHFHALARFRLTDDHRPPAAMTRNQPIYALIRHEVGLAKSRSARAISQAGLLPEGGVWAKRFKITAITDRRHQIAVANYIARHAEHGGGSAAAH